MKNRVIGAIGLLVISMDFPVGAKPVSEKLQGGGSFASTDSTNVDFSETMIDGKMQAPQGFFLQGKKSQTLSNMVRLRSNFRSELRNSKSAVKAIIK